mmetsp:Transcript_27189/g.74255  ORF Transcript_27189/g.74255 Transcript_27189/m.74255 type:complete len:205 (+) Transcript_27189:302-916(+)
MRWRPSPRRRRRCAGRGAAPHRPMLEQQVLEAPLDLATRHAWPAGCAQEWTCTTTSTPPAPSASLLVAWSPLPRGSSADRFLQASLLSGRQATMPARTGWRVSASSIQWRSRLGTQCVSTHCREFSLSTGTCITATARRPYLRTTRPFCTCRFIASDTTSFRVRAPPIRWACTMGPGAPLISHGGARAWETLNTWPPSTRFSCP